jgi:hypothetical protein
LKADGGGNVSDCSAQVSQSLSFVLSKADGGGAGAPPRAPTEPD